MKAWTIIQNEEQYQEVMERIEELSLNPPALESEEGRELYLLGFLADKYESEKFPISYPDPIKAIIIRMKELNLKVSDLINAFGDRGTASKVLNKKRHLSLHMVRHLSKQLDLPVSLLIKPTRLSTKLNAPNYKKRTSKKSSNSLVRAKRSLTRKNS